MIPRPLLLASSLTLALVLASCGPDEPDGPPPIEPVTEPTLTSTPIEVFHEVAEGETFGEICSAHGIPYAQTLEMVAASEDVHELTRIRSGRIMQMRFAPDTDALVDLAYPMGEDAWIVVQGSPGYEVTVEEVPYEVETVAVAGEVTSSFWGMGSTMGLRAGDIIALSEIFEYDIDFATEVRAGDKLGVWMEALSLDGNFVKYGQVMAARYINDGEATEAYLFTPEGEKAGYYTAEGMSTRKKFLRSPLKFSRVASGFSRSRFHPILKKNRPHVGTDFSAPTGTPIRALGNGRVTFSGWRGGYGNLVIIQHDEKYSTRYGHLSKYGKGIKSGTNVEQGQIIGYVGATGLATGPHLHFEFRVHGEPVDFMRQDFPNTEPVSKEEMPRFVEERDALRAHLDQLLPAEVSAAPETTESVE